MCTGLVNKIRLCVGPYVPKVAPCQLLLKLSGLWSIDSEIGLRKLLFLGRLLTGDKMAPDSLVRNLFQIRSQSYFNANIVSLGVLPSICEALHKYELFSYFDSWFSDSMFPTCSQWKSIVKTKIREFEVNTFCNYPPQLQTCQNLPGSCVSSVFLVYL